MSSLTPAWSQDQPLEKEKISSSKHPLIKMTSSLLEASTMRKPKLTKVWAMIRDTWLQPATIWGISSTWMPLTLSPIVFLRTVTSTEEVGRIYKAMLEAFFVDNSVTRCRLFLVPFSTQGFQCKTNLIFSRVHKWLCLSMGLLFPQNVTK